MIDSKDTSMLAAEYALGTLDEAERRAVSTQRLADAELDAEILSWELRLAPLSEQVENRQPARNLLPGILARLPTDLPGGAQLDETTANIVYLKTKISRWRAAAFASAAIAAGLAAVLIFTPPLQVEPQPSYVAVFQKDDQQPAFLLSINLETRAVTIQPVTADAHSEKTYQLWILEESLGPTPQSLGLLNPVNQLTNKSLAEFDADILKTATFGISLEPQGGSPTGKPSEGAIHGFLYPALITEE